MQATVKEVREKIKEVWPRCKFSWILDKYLILPTEADMKFFLESSRVPKMKFVSGFHDCDNFSKQFVAEVERKRYLAYEEGMVPKDQQFQLALGIAVGKKFRGIPKHHVTAVAVCQDGVFLVDTTPYENRMWQATPEKDAVYFILI